MYGDLKCVVAENLFLHIMNCNIICCDGNVDFDLGDLKNCSGLCHELFQDTCVCTATLHLPSLTCDLVRLAMEIVMQGVKVPNIEVVESVFSLLGISWTPKGLDHATGQLQVTVIVTILMTPLMIII